MMTKKENHKTNKRPKAIDIETKQLNKIHFFGLIFAILMLDLLAVWLSWWFYETITKNSSLLEIFVWVAPIVLLLSTFLSMVGILFLLMQNSKAYNVLKKSAYIGAAGLFMMFINITVFVLKNNYSESLRSLWESFVDFNRVSIGALNFSITTALTLFVIFLAVFSDKGKK